MFKTKTHRRLRMLRLRQGTFAAISPDFQRDERFLSSPRRDESVFRDDDPLISEKRSDAKTSPDLSGPEGKK